MFLVNNGVFMFKESELKILNYLSLSESGEGFISQIAREIELSKGEVSKSVKTLKRAGLVRSRMSGRNMVCSVERSSPVFIRLRIAFNILEIMPAVAAFREYAEKIILFGSCAAGTDTDDSDIDILIITREQEKVLMMAGDVNLPRPVKWIIKTPQEYVVLADKEEVLFEEISRGIVLHEAMDEDS